jgi:hypothetical protein
MSIASKIQEMSAQGMPASAIASALGVSRQRVYQAAKQNGIALPKYHYAERATPRPPRPRVITGGVETTVSHATAGTVSELLVAADMLARGWLVYMPVMHSRGHDLIATRNGALVTVEVRSAHRSATGSLVFAKKPEETSTHYALVVTGEPVHYKPDLPE